MPGIVRAFEGMRRNADGAEIAEAALVLPLVFMLLLGIVWFGRVFNIYSTMQQAAQQGAILAARPVCATCPPGGGWNGFPSDNAVDSAVVSVLQASSIDTTQVMAFSPAPTPCTLPPNIVGACAVTGHNVTVCRDVQVDVTQPAQTQPAQCGTVVSFQYPFRFYLPFTSLNMQSITLTATAQSRMEN
jgi:TadE-like protein